MKPDKVYEVIKRIKLHTKPLVISDVVLTGKFKKETNTQLVFDKFRVKKSVVVSIKELN